MTRCDAAAGMAVLVLALAGCGEDRRVYTTSGTATIACDESVFPVMKLEAEDFMHTYKDAVVTLRSVEDREAIADLLNDSVKVIVSARPFNAEEKGVIAASKIEMQEFRIAMDAVVVIGHKDIARKELRCSELDSIFSGTITRWPGKRRDNVIDVVIGGVNSSTNEVFRETLLGGRPFAPSATPMPSGMKLVDYVSATPNAIGIVGLSWTRGRESGVTVFALGRPGERPDSTQPVGKFYSPLQAHIYRKYYPLTRPVYFYTRSYYKDVAYGFISHVTSPPGQQLFVNNGLVPMTMPVRLVELTSQQVQ